MKPLFWRIWTWNVLQTFQAIPSPRWLTQIGLAYWISPMQQGAVLPCEPWRLHQSFEVLRSNRCVHILGTFWGEWNTCRVFGESFCCQKSLFFCWIFKEDKKNKIWQSFFWTLQRELRQQSILKETDATRKNQLDSIDSGETVQEPTCQLFSFGKDNSHPTKWQMSWPGSDLAKKRIRQWPTHCRHWGKTP